MITKRLAIPFVFWIVIVLYLAYVKEIYGVSQWIFPPLLILTALYIFNPQIEWWWYNRFPPKIDPKLKSFLLRASPFYAALSPENKDKFEKRIFFYLIGNDFSGMNMESVTEDMKATVAMYPIALTFSQNNFLLAPYERIIFYKHPFPSPNHRFLHASETNVEDGVIIFSFEQLLQSQYRPDAFINLGYYEYAQVYSYVHNKRPAPLVNEQHWDLIENISGINRESVIKFTGYKVPSLLGCLTSMFFDHPVKLQRADPTLYNELSSFYELDPIKLYTS